MTEGERLWGLVAAATRGALVTQKSDGRPQLSNGGYAFDAGARTAVVSTTAGRAKTHNLRRDPRCSLYVTTQDLGAYAVAEGRAELGAVASRVDDAVTDRLVEHYRGIRGDHPDWDEFRAAMVAERRLLVRLDLVRVYGWAGI
ncbi:MAG: PPOX class F420-dependent oxidoreductase [Actinomycetia bacterium]|nr:PPOX class F420-dependent oxidoreductase [Actinomycetes bacterium]